MDESRLIELIREGDPLSFEILFQLGFFSGKVDFFQQGLDGLSTHICHKSIGVVFACLTVVILRESHTGFEAADITGIGNDKLFVVENTLQFLCRHVKDETDTAGHTLEKPDVGNRNSQFDMSHALAAHF